MGMMGVKRWKKRPPAPEVFDGVPTATEAADKRVLLYVGASDHLPNEYAPAVPGWHRTFRLCVAGNGG